MKKFTLILFLIIFAIPVFADNKEVTMVDANKPVDRSISAVPKVWFDNSIMELSVSFTSDIPTYEILVQDVNGTVICQFTYSSNGFLYQFFIPEVPSGDYEVVVKTAKNSYSGDLIID